MGPSLSVYIKHCGHIVGKYMHSTIGDDGDKVVASIHHSPEFDETYMQGRFVQQPFALNDVLVQVCTPAHEGGISRNLYRWFGLVKGYSC